MTALSAVLLVPVGVAGCGGTQEAEVPTAEPEPPPKPKPKPKPKCEDFAEKCTATADTQAKIAGTNIAFIPPEGWMYAQQANATMAKPDGGPGAIAMSGFDGSKDEAKARDAEYDRLLGLLGMEPPAKFKVKYKPNWAKPEATRKSGEMEIKLWQTDGAKRDGKAGILNVILTSEPGGKKILGVVFTLDNDEKTAEAVNKSLETIGPAPY